MVVLSKPFSMRGFEAFAAVIIVLACLTQG